jgi:hypothetical protein
MAWFNSNPPGQDATFTTKMNWRAHEWGKSTFPGSFAKGGGFTATAFAPTGKEAFSSAWRRPLESGSQQHIANLRRMQAADPKNGRITNALKKAEAGPGRMGTLGTIGGGVIRAGFVALPAFLTPGSGYEKGMAVGRGMASVVGWDVGMKAGMATGAAIGSAVPLIGTAIGAGVGAIAGAFAGSVIGENVFDAVSSIPTGMVDETRKRRGLNWAGDTSAFNTQKAHTMRQQSLQAMNRGMMNARSMLGREAMMIHQ